MKRRTFFQAAAVGSATLMVPQSLLPMIQQKGQVRNTKMVIIAG